MMFSLKFDSNPKAQWYDLVNEAQHIINITLGEELESYLVFLLMRFIKRDEIVNTTLALELLNSSQSSTRVSAEQLQKLGDTSLLLAGFYPNRANKKHVRTSYFVSMGKTAYDLRSNCFYKKESLFHHLAFEFVKLMDVLQAMHGIDNAKATPLLLPLQAYELWEDTSSKSAEKIIQNGDEKSFIINASVRTNRH